MNNILSVCHSCFFFNRNFPRLDLCVRIKQTQFLLFLCIFLPAVFQALPGNFCSSQTFKIEQSRTCFFSPSFFFCAGFCVFVPPCPHPPKATGHSHFCSVITQCCLERYGGAFDGLEEVVANVRPEPSLASPPGVRCAGRGRELLTHLGGWGGAMEYPPVPKALGPEDGHFSNEICRGWQAPGHKTTDCRGGGGLPKGRHPIAQSTYLRSSVNTVIFL